MSEDIKHNEVDSVAADSISDENVYKYCTRCGAKNYLCADVCFNCERCSDFVDSFDEYEKLKQSETAATVQAMLEAERKKMEAEITARLEKQFDQKQSRQDDANTYAASPSLDAIIEQIDIVYRDGGSFERKKELAWQLQCERSKPENKTGDNRKRANEALRKLIKAMVFRN